MKYSPATTAVPHQARLGALALALAASWPAFGQSAIPDAGQTLRELQQQAAPPRARAKTVLSVPADAAAAADLGQRFPVRQVRIDGNTRIASAELDALVAGLAGREASLGELRQAAASITALYRVRGFVVARAFVPAQQIDDGVVRISVLEGSLRSTTVQNGSIVQTAVLNAFVAAQRLEGGIIESARTDRELLLLADLPGAGAVNGKLKPGAEVGTSDLLVTVEPGKAREGDVSLDNYGNRYTGQTRLNGRLDLNSPLGLGDRLSLRATATDEGLLYGRAAFDLPVNRDGWRAGAAASSSRYELGREFAGLDASGTANTLGLYTSYPLLRGLNANVWFSGALDARKMKDEVHSSGVATHRSARAGSADVYGDFADAVGGGGYSTWRASVLTGSLDIDSAAALAADRAGPRTEGRYHKYALAATRLQAVTAQTSAFVSVAAQWAGKNLDSSEKFVLGGVQGVRAYPQGEGVGDEGVLASVELRHDFSGGLQGSLFYDYGHVTFNRDSFAAGADSATLKAYGFSFGARYRAFNAKATLAWRDTRAAASAPDRSPRLWLGGGWSF